MRGFLFDSFFVLICFLFFAAWKVFFDAVLHPVVVSMLFPEPTESS